MYRRSHRLLQTFYLTSFAALGLYVPYFNLHLRALGFPDREIGFLLAMLPLAKATLPAVWGMAADRSGQRRLLLAASTWLAAGSFAGFLAAESFTACLVVMAFYATFSVPALPFVEATTLEVLEASGGRYGRIRVAGSLGFASTALLYGWLAGSASSSRVVPAMLIMLAINACIASLIIPPPPARRAPAPPPLTFLRHPPIILLLAAGFLMQASHGAYLGFFSLVLQEAGYSSLAVGAAWGGAIGAEVIMMLWVDRLAARLGVSRLLALSVAAAALRWGMYAVTLSPLVLVLGQGLHAFTYAGFHVAAVKAIFRLFPRSARATGQALYSGLTYGAGLTAGTMISGLVKEKMGQAAMFWVACALALASLGLILGGAGRKPGQTES